MSEIKAGDIVQCKTGGPWLNVENVVDVPQGRFANVTWMVNNVERHDSFAVEALVRVDDLEAELTAQEQRTAALLESRNAYRDGLRRILGVTKPDGEELIALVEARLHRLIEERDDLTLRLGAKVAKQAKRKVRR